MKWKAPRATDAVISHPSRRGSAVILVRRFHNAKAAHDCRYQRSDGRQSTASGCSRWRSIDVETNLVVSRAGQLTREHQPDEIQSIDGIKALLTDHPFSAVPLSRVIGPRKRPVLVAPPPGTA